MGRYIKRGVILIIAILLTSGVYFIVSKNTNNKNIETQIIYCNDCGKPSNELSKFCPECGKEAKWTKDKPEIKQEEEENNTKEDTKEIKKDAKEKETKKVTETQQCGNCGNYFPKGSMHKFYEGLLCNDCYKLPKTCENGFYDICEGCKLCRTISFNEAIEIAEKHYDLKDGDDIFIVGEDKLYYDDKGSYYKMWAKSNEMIEQGGNGVLLYFIVYGDGTVVDDYDI